MSSPAATFFAPPRLPLLRQPSARALANPQQKSRWPRRRCHIHAPVSLTSQDRKDATVKSVWTMIRRVVKNTPRILALAQSPTCRTFVGSEIKAVVIYSETNRILNSSRLPRRRASTCSLKNRSHHGKESLAMADAIEKAVCSLRRLFHARRSQTHFLKGEIAKELWKDHARPCSNCHSGALEGWFDKDYRWMTDPKSPCRRIWDLGTHNWIS